MQKRVLELRTERLKQAKEILENSEFGNRLERGFPTDPIYLPFFLSEVALDESLAKDLWLRFVDWIVFEEGKSMNDPRGFIIISIISGKNLAPKDINGTDPVVTVKYGELSKDTQVIQKELNPKWNKSISPFKFHKDKDYPNSDYPNIFVFPYVEKQDVQITCRDDKSAAFMGQFKVKTEKHFEQKKYPS